ncbi:MAG: acetate kinase, partial [Firmicutes bacterium]|nr:acetate kinase [Candidatus Fiminaster equi]
KLFEMPEEKVLCSGNAERIGHEDAIFGMKWNGESEKKVLPILDHARAVELVVEALLEKGIVKDMNEIVAVGHRIVQGGKYFSKSALFDEDTEAKIEALIPLAPLHNKAHLVGFRAFKKILPNVTNVAVFDTAFHQTMEPEDYVFPIPKEFTEKYDCRRYGAHGTSHKYLSEMGLKYLPGVEHPRIISCHIGSGASITAIKDGKCVATSMGLTPLGGIMMGTRTGDLDPSVMNYLCKCTGKSVEEMYQIFNKQSGFQGVSTVSNDSRDVIAAAEAGNKDAQLSIRLFTRRIADFIGQYFVRLGGADLIIFSAGIGENSVESREDILKEITPALGLSIDYEANKARGKEVLLSKPDSKIKVVVIPTDEEVMIARDTFSFYRK